MQIDSSRALVASHHRHSRSFGCTKFWPRACPPASFRYFRALSQRFVLSPINKPTRLDSLLIPPLARKQSQQQQQYSPQQCPPPPSLEATPTARIPSVCFRPPRRARLPPLTVMAESSNNHRDRPPPRACRSTPRASLIGEESESGCMLML